MSDWRNPGPSDETLGPLGATGYATQRAQGVMFLLKRAISLGGQVKRGSRVLFTPERVLSASVVMFGMKARWLIQWTPELSFSSHPTKSPVHTRRRQRGRQKREGGRYHLTPSFSPACFPCIES